MTTYEAFIDQNVPRWLEPAMLQEQPERLEAFRSISSRLSTDLDGRVFDAVLATHGTLGPEIERWVGDHVRATDESLVYEGKEELQRRLVSIAVIRHVALADDDAAILAALAALSASFIGLDAVLPELPEMSVNRLDELGREKRSRALEPESSVAQSLGSLPRTRKPDEESGVPVDANQLASDLGSHAKAIRGLATAVDSALRLAQRRQGALDEEVEMLWWVIKERTGNGALWSDQPALSRAVNGAIELAERTLEIPGPPSAAALLRRLLGDAGEEEVTLADVAAQIAACELPPQTSPHSSLIPLIGSSEVLRELREEGDNETWQNVAKKQLGVDTRASSTLSRASEQVYRELQILRLLGE
jgi:GTPase-associated system helical domain